MYKILIGLVEFVIRKGDEKICSMTVIAKTATCNEKYVVRTSRPEILFTKCYRLKMSSPDKIHETLVQSIYTIYSVSINT